MHHFTQDELKILVREVRKPRRSHDHEQLHALMILVAFSYGLRASEVTQLTGADVRGGYIAVQRLKGSQKTVQKIIKHPDPELDCSADLRSRADEVGLDGRLFPMSRKRFWVIIQTFGKRAGLPPHKLHPHALKHSCARVAIKAGIENCRQWLGHKSLSSTGAYLKVTDDEASDAFAAAVAQ